MRIDIWSDIVCPFCLLGEHRLQEALRAWEHGDQVDIVWHSFELDPHADTELTGGLAKHIAAKYGVSIEQAEGSQAGIAAQFAEAGAFFNWQQARPGNTFDAHRVFHLAVDKGIGEQVMSRLMRGYFSEGAAIGDQATIKALAVEAGLDAADVQQVLDSDLYADAVRADEQAAARYGISGVPFFVFDERLGLSGAQPVEVFTQALEQAWQSRPMPLQTLAGADDVAACDLDGTCTVDEPTRV